MIATHTSTLRSQLLDERDVRGARSVLRHALGGSPRVPLCAPLEVEHARAVRVHVAHRRLLKQLVELREVAE